MQGGCEDPAAAPLTLSVDAASLLSLGWTAPSPALSAALPQPGALTSAPHTTLRGVLEAGHAVQVQLSDRPAAQDGYDSDATIVPSDNLETEPPGRACTAQPSAAKSLIDIQQLPASADVDAVSIAFANGSSGMPSWLPAALVTLQATAVVCADTHCEGTSVIGRRVAFLLLGELTVGDDGDERVLCEGLHVGRCTPRGAGASGNICCALL